jgi:hypothetical protein
MFPSFIQGYSVDYILTRINRKQMQDLEGVLHFFDHFARNTIRNTPTIIKMHIDFYRRKKWPAVQSGKERSLLQNITNGGQACNRQCDPQGNDGRLAKRNNLKLPQEISNYRPANQGREQSI